MSTYFKDFLVQAHNQGLTTAQALRLPEAQRAADMDEQALKSHHQSQSKNEFIQQFWTQRKADGINTPGFLDNDELQLAMGDPLYETSAAYREAVAEILSQTPDSVLNVSIDAKWSDGIKNQVNKTNEATVDTMLDNARREALREHVQSIDQSTAKGRYELMKFVKENPDAAQAIYEDITPRQFVTEASMLSDQQDGKRDAIVIPGTPNAGDIPNE